MKLPLPLEEVEEVPLNKAPPVTEETPDDALTTEEAADIALPPEEPEDVPLIEEALRLVVPLPLAK